DRRRDRLPALLPDAAVQPEGAPGPEDPRSMSHRGGRDPRPLRAPSPSRRRPGRDRADRRGRRGSRSHRLTDPDAKSQSARSGSRSAMDLKTFQAALHEGVEKERGLNWTEAADLYAELAKASSDPAMRAIALLRRGNALMELRRWDDARIAFDSGLHDAKESGDPGVIAQALLDAGVFAANRGA